MQGPRGPRLAPDQIWRKTSEVIFLLNSLIPMGLLEREREKIENLLKHKERKKED
jgi:hypothetical protein